MQVLSMLPLLLPLVQLLPVPAAASPLPRPTPPCCHCPAAAGGGTTAIAAAAADGGGGVAAATAMTCHCCW